MASVTLDGLLSGTEALILNVKVRDGEFENNKDAMKATLLGLATFIRDCCDGLDQEVVMEAIIGRFAESNLQTRGQKHHEAATAKLRAGNGMYAAALQVGGKNLELRRLALCCDTAYGQLKGTRESYPVTLYLARLAAGSSGYAELRKKNKMRSAFRAIRDDDDPVAGQVYLADNPDFVGGATTVVITTVGAEIGGRALDLYENLDGMLNQRSQVPVVIDWRTKAVTPHGIYAGGGIGFNRLKIVGVKTEETYPWTGQFVKMGLEGANSLETMTLNYYAYEEVYMSRPGMLNQISDAATKAASIAAFKTHTYGWFVKTLWPRVRPMKSALRKVSWMEASDACAAVSDPMKLALKDILNALLASEMKPADLPSETKCHASAKALERGIEKVCQSAGIELHELQEAWETKTALTMSALTGKQAQAIKTLDVFLKEVQKKNASIWGICRITPLLGVLLGKCSRPTLEERAGLPADDEFWENLRKSPENKAIERGVSFAAKKGALTDGSVRGAASFLFRRVFGDEEKVQTAAELLGEDVLKAF